MITDKDLQIATNLLSEFEEMTNSQQALTMSIIISRKSNRIIHRISTVSVRDYFSGCGVVMLCSLKPMHKRLTKVKLALSKAGKITSDMFEHSKLNVLPGHYHEHGSKTTWLMNDDGFCNLLMNIPGSSDDVINLKDDVLKSLKYTSKVASSLTDRGYGNYLITEMSKISSGNILASFSTSDLLQLNADWTMQDIKYFSKQYDYYISDKSRIENF